MFRPRIFGTEEKLQELRYPGNYFSDCNKTISLPRRQRVHILDQNHDLLGEQIVTKLLPNCYQTVFGIVGSIFLFSSLGGNNYSQFTETAPNTIFVHAGFFYRRVSVHYISKLCLSKVNPSLQCLAVALCFCYTDINYI